MSLLLSVGCRQAVPLPPGGPGSPFCSQLLRPYTKGDQLSPGLFSGAVPKCEITMCHCFCYTNHCKCLSGARPLLPLASSSSVQINLFFPDNCSCFLSYLQQTVDVLGCPKLPRERSDPSVSLDKTGGT